MHRDVLLALLFVSSTALGAEQVVWQIGKPDHSYSEFAFAGDYLAYAKQFGANRVVFEAGRSDPARDWPFIQPGPADGWAPGRGQPWTIRFTLPETPRGVFTLRIDLADVNSHNPPRYVVALGGRIGTYQLPAGGGDASLTNPRAGKPHKIELTVPASFFKKGTNEIRLTCADGSWVQYDAITLVADAEGAMPVPAIQNVTVRPTPFFIRRDGKVCRALDVAVELTAPAPEIVLRVEAAGRTVETPVKQLGVFGAVTEEVGVPDSAEPIDVKVTAMLGNQSKSTSVRVLPQRKWRIFVAPSSHTDIGYTAIQAQCAERHCQNADVAIDLMHKFPDFCWNLEVAWQGENYVHSRTGERLADFYRYAREGRLGIQALYCNILTGLCSVEESCRFTWCAHRICHDKGIALRSAMISDVPTQEAGMPMLLSGAGIRYFSSGINNDRAYTFTKMQEKCPCWWEGPDGSRVLMMYTWQYAQAEQWALTHTLEQARSRVLEKLKHYEDQANYPYDAVFLHGAVSDNCPLNPNLAEVAKQWNERYEFPKIILSHNAEFFEYIEKHYGEKLPVYRGSAGTFWEDGAGSSARETTLCRNAHEAVANGEKLLALAERIGKLKQYCPEAIYQVWRNCMLYDEHTWGAHCSISQPESEFTKSQWKVKAQFAVDADKGATALLKQAAGALASLVHTEGPALVVFNPMSWTRTDVVRVDLPEGLGVVEPDVQAYTSPHGTYMTVKDVPACGYRVLKLGPQAKGPATQPEAGNSIESRFYRVEFDPDGGGVVSIRDKELDRELVDPKAPFRMNQYVYAAGGKGSRIVMNPAGPVPELKITTSGKAKLQRRRKAGVGEMMAVETSGTMAPGIVSAVLVWDDIKRIDFVNFVKKELTYDKEGVYFAFPFAPKQPTLRYEAPGAIVNANKDMLPGACLNWFTVQHFVEVEGRDAAITWATPDAPLVCFQDINRGNWLTQLPMANSHLYAYVMNNYWHTNYLAGQSGPHVFRFAVTSRAKADNVASARFGWAASNPMVGVVVKANPQGPLPEIPISLVSVAEPGVIVTGTKLANEGGGLIVRLWELTGRATTAHVQLDRHIPAAKAQACNLMEEPLNPLEIHDGVIAVPVRGSGLATIRIE